MGDKRIRIGGASGFWGDTDQGAAQLLRLGQVDYLVFDYLAEITMSLLSRLRAKDPAKGYVPDFVTGVVAPLAGEIAAKGVKLVANAGGVNPVACAQAIEAALAAAGVPLKVAAVTGDDLLPQLESLRPSVREMFTGAALPAKPWSLNAYLGAFPIARALAAGADIVVTGRCVDSALALGPLIHAFAWGERDFDRLAAGSLAGHIIECGPQATGGLFTDWREVPGWDDMGFPIVDCAADGSFVVTKPPGTGGLVTPATVAEQITYEIGDPAAYLLPDVTADFSGVTLAQEGPDRVSVSGARGYAPGPDCKASATFHDGFRVVGTMMVGGREAAPKARRIAEATLARVRRLMAARGLGDFRASDVEVLGAEATYGEQARGGASREVILKVALSHADKEALEIFSREFIPAATSMAPGITGFAGGRPKVQPLISLFSCLVPKTALDVAVEMAGVRTPVPFAALPTQPRPLPPVPEDVKVAANGATVPLIALAHGRSGDKGDKANISVLARRPEYLPLLRSQVTAAAVKHWLSHLVLGQVERFEWPGLGGFNFLLHEALGGGGTSSLRYDPQGKALAQMLLDLPVAVPGAWLKPGGPLAEWGGAAA